MDKQKMAIKWGMENLETGEEYVFAQFIYQKTGVGGSYWEVVKGHEVEFEEGCWRIRGNDQGQVTEYRVVNQLSESEQP
jgi:hypothetical protein